MSVVLVFAFSFSGSVLAQAEGEGETSDPQTETTATNPAPQASGGSAIRNLNEAEISILEPQSWWTWIITEIVSAIISLLGFILSKMSIILIWLAGYNGFVKSEAVQIGWVLVRDLCNLFFVLILLIISLATILRVESYNFKRLLPRVIIMAIMVNFSLLIAGLAIDFSQVVMLTFVAGFAATVERGGAGLLDALRINQMTSGITGQIDPNGELWQLVATSFFAIIMLIVAVFVILVMMVVLLMRMIMLWILLILSPLPYLLGAFPQGQRYASQWWSEFTKYLIVGPMLAFFLWLALAVTSGDNKNVLDGVGDSNAKQSLDALSQQESESPQNIFINIGEIDNLIAFMIAIAMLMGGLAMTQKIGAAGAGFAGNMYGRLRQAGLRGALAPVNALRSGLGLGAGLAGKGVKTARTAAFGATGISLSPSRFSRGLQARYESWEERMKQQGKARGGEAATNRITSEGRFGAVQRAYGLARLAGASPKDFAERYVGFRGLKSAARTIVKGTGQEEFRKFEKQKEEDAKKIASYKKFGEVDARDKKGRDVLLEETKKKIGDDLDSGNFANITTKDQITGKYSAKKFDKTDYEHLLDNADKDDLKELGLSDKYKINEDSKKGIAFKDDEAKQDFKKDFIKIHAERMLDEVGKYENKTTGNLEDLSNTALDEAGKRFYDEQETKKVDELDRVTHGGITDLQLEARQDQLESINNKMLAVLKKIEKQGGRATAGDQEDLNRFKDEGEKLGGKTVKDAVTGYKHFGASSTDRNNVYKIKGSDITGKAEATKEERESITKKDSKTEKNMIDKLSDQLVDFREEKRLASLPEADRQAEKERYKKEAENIDKNLKVKDKSLRQEFEQAPLPYESLAAFRAAEGEELKKLPKSMEWSEIRSELDSAIKLKNIPKVRALIKKAAADGNDNEVLNDFGFESSFEGMQEFGKKVLQEQLGMKNQEMLHFLSDVGYINEAVGHYETSRMVGVDRGVARFNTPEDHAAQVSNENLKKNSRNFLQNTNRLGFGGEHPDTGYKITMSGMLTLSGLGDGEIVNRISRGEFNPSLLSKLASDVEGLQKMVKKGLLKQRTVDLIKKEAGKKLVEASYGDLEEKARILNT